MGEHTPPLMTTRPPTVHQWVLDSIGDVGEYRHGVQNLPGGNYMGDRWQEDGCVFALFCEHTAHEWVHRWARENIANASIVCAIEPDDTWVHRTGNLYLYAGPKLTLDLCATEETGTSWKAIPVTRNPNTKIGAHETVTAMRTLLAHIEHLPSPANERFDERIKDITGRAYNVVTDTERLFGNHTLSVAVQLLGQHPNISVGEAIELATAVCEQQPANAATKSGR